MRALLRDFLNGHAISAPRKPFWGISTINALLQPNTLLKYAGYEVWNVHRKNGTKRPPDEWVVVENAHEALIAEELAMKILKVRERAGKKAFARNRSLSSSYLLSGGLFTCERCGANMIGFKQNSRAYYVCGSQPYRKGAGCGKGVYVPQAKIESAVLEGVQDILDQTLDPAKIVKQVNREVDRLWKETMGETANVGKQVQAIETKIANVRRSIENGLADTAWANGRLAELQAQKKALDERGPVPHKPPRLDAGDVARYTQSIKDLLETATFKERKELLRQLVDRIELAPERLTVEVVYRTPGPVVMNSVVAGVGFEPTTFGL